MNTIEDTFDIQVRVLHVLCLMIMFMDLILLNCALIQAVESKKGEPWT